MGWLRPLLVVLARIVSGVLLASVLSVVGIGIAWGLFVFSGAVSHATLLSLFMTGAGIGAGVGGFTAWIKVDKAPPWPLLLAGALAVVLAGIGGAWGGFQFGANQEVPCCVGPAITPITYTALGATAAANVAALAMGVAHEIRARRGWKRSRAENGSSAVSSSTEARRLTN